MTNDGEQSHKEIPSKRVTTVELRVEPYSEKPGLGTNSNKKMVL